MHSAVLAIYAVCGVAVHLEPQTHLADAVWPTHAFVTLPQGWVKPDEQMFLLEDGRPIAAQIEVQARWPDDSPKWVHAYAGFRYANGKPARYEFEKRSKLPEEIAESPLSVVDKPAGITVKTGVITISIPRPFSGVAIADAQGKPVVAPGGPGMIDDRGIVWHAKFDGEAEIAIEQQGPAQVTVKCSGWYQSESKRVQPFCKFVTRITVSAGSPIVRFDHATIFADDMHKHAIGALPFRFSVPDVQGYVSGDLSGQFRDAHTATFFAQLSADRLVTIDQQNDQDSPAPPFTEIGTRSPGWFAADTTAARVVLLTKDFWQKFPKEVKIGRNELVYYAWPKHGALAKADDDALRLNKIYKFPCFHTGQFFDARLPDEYFTALQLQTDTRECKAEYARAANPVGVAIHNEFALAVLPREGPEPHDDTHLAALEKLYVQNPIARVVPAAVAVSGVLGPVAASGRDFPQQERVVRDAMLGYAASIERYGDYGWAIYGNAHHEELMNPQAAGIEEGRPSLHRVWSNNHYQYVSTAWRLYALHGDPRLLRWARTCTDVYASIGQVRYDPMTGYVDGNGKRQPGASIKYHVPGGFYHCKALVPWGGRDYGMDRLDSDANLRGHWTDPSSLLLAWLFDANRWAKDGYELWLDNYEVPTNGTNRETNSTLVHAITAYEYRPNEKMLADIRKLGTLLMKTPILKQYPGSIWEPTWLSRYHELFPEDKAFAQYVLTSLETLGVRREALWTLALSATAYQITGDDKHLRQHAGSLARIARSVFYDPKPDKRWDRYGLAPGPARDGQFMAQWHRFLYALRKAGITELPPPAEPGHYLGSACRFDNPQDVAARGTTILVLKDQPGPLDVNLAGGTLRGGDLSATSLGIFSPTGKNLLHVDRIPMTGVKPVINQVTRPSTWVAAVEQYSVDDAGTGLYRIVMGAYLFGAFQTLTGLPECELLRGNKLSNWSEPCVYAAKISRGYLVPLVDTPIALQFTAMGDRDGAHIALHDADGKPLVNQWIRAGDSVVVHLNRPRDGMPAGKGPWLLDAFSDHSGYFRMEIAADADEPLLFGSNLEHVQAIRQRLGR